MTNSEKALQMHEQWNGKIETIAKSHVNSREDLAIAYTPGVAEPCKVIAQEDVYKRQEYAPCPEIINTHSLKPPIPFSLSEIISTFQRRPSA